MTGNSTVTPATVSAVARWTPGPQARPRRKTVSRLASWAGSDPIELKPDACEAAAGERQRVIEIEQYVLRNELDARYIGVPYYIVPDGDVGRQAFAVIREVLDRQWMAALARITFTSREHIVALVPRGRALLAMTLRYPWELRNEDAFVADIPEQGMSREMLEFVSYLVEAKAGRYDPTKVEYTFEEALQDLIKKQQHGKRVEQPDRG